jgi:16S rRNA (cytosine967-C5)-methyltransferase
VGGILVYCTCSILAEENDEVVVAFLKCTPDASVRAIAATWGPGPFAAVSFLPSEGGADGFYYAALENDP